MSYGSSGVNYDLIDPLKVAAQRAAASTGGHLDAHGFTEVEASRGESAYVVDVGPFYLASIVECLGSKALVADEMQAPDRPEPLRRDRAGHDRDGGQRPDHRRRDAARRAGLLGRRRLATGSPTPARAPGPGRGLEAGLRHLQAWPGAAARRRRWPASSRPAGSTSRPSCTGIVNPKERLSLGDQLAPGDAIVLLASSGIHANGLSLARKLVERLPQGYLTPLTASAVPIGYGEALLAPTVLYSPVTEALFKAGIAPHYCANITGHGWRKLLRHRSDFTYRIHARARRCRRC